MGIGTSTGSVTTTLADALATHPDLASRLQFMTPVSSATVELQTSSRLPDVSELIRDGLRQRTDIATMLEFARAQQAIDAKGAALGGLAGAAVADVDVAGTGYVRRYSGCDIYYSDQTGAFEVHGDIRAKYDALRGATGSLGLPLTDESGTPDGIGRYNHFQSGSIYWTPTTGPMVVRGAVRDLWASQGWERSSFGYPVLDAHREQIADPNNNPPREWSVFQNGAIFSLANSAAPALVAEVAPDKLAGLVRNMLDEALHQANGDLGIEGGGRIVRVEDWAYGFWASRPRLITFAVDGFHDNGVLPDTTFHLELTLEFDLTWAASFTEPVAKTLVANLKRLHIDTSGLGNETLLNGLRDGIKQKFQDSLAIRTIPVEALLIDVLVTPAGGLQFLLEPDIANPPFGGVRRIIFQNQLDALTE
jgi:hypothetical protein